LTWELEKGRQMEEEKQREGRKEIEKTQREG